MSTATANAKEGERKYIGKPMDKPEWSAAIQKLGGRGKILLPAPLAEYAGRVIQISETHIVQQVGPGLAVAHDLTKLSIIEKPAAGPELMGKDFDFKYGQDKGEGKLVTFNERRAEYVKEEAKKWAETNISQDASRKAFLKHIDNFSNHLAISKERKVDKAADMPAAKPERAPSPGR